MKKSIAMLIAVVMILGFCACGSSGPVSNGFEDVKQAMQSDDSEHSVGIGSSDDGESVSYGEVDVRQAGKIKIDELLYTAPDDSEYLTPDSDDFMVIIYDIPVTYLVPDYTVYKDSYGLPIGFGLLRSGNEYSTSCKYTRVISFTEGSVTGPMKEKLEFETEADALHPYMASSEENWIMFDDGIIPDDFNEEDAIRIICDENLPANTESGTSLTRKNNIWYKSYSDSSGGYFILSDLAGFSVRNNGKNFSAKQVDELGFSSFSMDYETMTPQNCDVTVYYSDPYRHGKRADGGYTIESVSDRFDNPGDDKYFSPATDDYLYYIEEDGASTDLMSFDSDGNLVQWVNRRDDNAGGYASMLYDDDLLQYITLSDDKMVQYEDVYKSAEDNDCLRTESYSGRTIKWDCITDRYSSLYYGSIPGQLLMSKGLTVDDSRVENDEDPLLESMKAIIPEGYDDYLLEIDDDKYTTEASISDGITWHDAIAYYWAYIYLFDTEGGITRQIRVQIFDDASMIEEEIKRTYGAISDSSGKTTINDEYYEPWREKNDPQIKDNLYYYDTNTENRFKWDFGQDDEYLRYFSKPYLTDIQLEAMDIYFN